MSSTLSVSDVRWDRHEVAEFFGIKDASMRELEKKKDFPAPFRLRFDNKGKDTPFWFPDEIIAWAKKFRTEGARNDLSEIEEDIDE